MRCKDCINFKTSTRMEAGSELAPRMGELKGQCSINNSSCKSHDECRVGKFSQK